MELFPNYLADTIEPCFGDWQASLYMRQKTPPSPKSVNVRPYYNPSSSDTRGQMKLISGP